MGNVKRVPNLLNDDLKRDILMSQLIPSKNSNYPSIIHNKKQLKFQPHWVIAYNWIAYSQEEDGVYCKVCLLFCTNIEVGKGSHENAGALVTSSFKRWKSASDKFSNHAKSEYHKKNVISSENFLKILSEPTTHILSQVDEQRKKGIQKTGKH